jgi:alkylation response protein AidB-like acyl-CoA dehydrogenase
VRELRGGYSGAFAIVARVKLQYDESTEIFRQELRSWLAENAPSREEMVREPPLSSAHFPEWARGWQRRLFDAGWLVPGWPRELGGRDASPVEQLVYFEELADCHAQRSYNIQGLTIITPSIRDFGSAEQAERFVMPSLRAELSWCLGMSEPGAGSDLASLSTRAEVLDDHFLVTGQKVWTSGAEHADYCLCFVRTDPDAAKHRGISVVIIDMKSPGINVRPLPELTQAEHADFSEVFFDSVRVPRENLVGELNNGWRISAGSLAHERGMLWLSQSVRIERRIESLIELGELEKPGGGRWRDDAHFRDQVASIFVESQALKFMGYSGFGKFARGEASPEHSTLKLLGSELDQKLALLGLEVAGPRALDVSDDTGWFGPISDDPPPWSNQYLRTFGNTIAGGTSEIQRNIIAQRVLGLPRG